MPSLTNPQLTNPLMQLSAAASGASRSGSASWSRYYPIICAFVLLTVDCVALLASAIVVSCCVALLCPSLGGLFHSDGTPARLDFVALSAAIMLYLAGKGRYRERIPFWTETRSVVCASLCAAGAEVMLGLLTNDIAAAVPTLAALLVFPVPAIAANRLVKRTLLLAGLWTLPVVVIGDEQGAADVEEILASDRALGYRFVGRVDAGAAMAAPTTSKLQSVLNRYHARHLLIALHGEQQRLVIECALRERVPFAVVPPPFAFPAFACEPAALFSHDTMLLSFRDGLSRPIARTAKVATDVSIAAVLLICTSPLFLILAVVSRLDGGPMLYAHRRVGAGGRPFNCLKFRTMVVGADAVLAEALAGDPALAAEWEATRKLVNDPRVTRIGNLLRKTSLDELPQLINVLRLEMSLVGPRPIVESEIPLYGENIAQYYATRPGVTGLWQVSGRSNTSYARRVQLDVWYVNNWTFWHDIAVLLKTIPAVLGRQGAI